MIPSPIADCWISWSCCAISARKRSISALFPLEAEEADRIESAEFLRDEPLNAEKVGVEDGEGDGEGGGDLLAELELSMVARALRWQNRDGRIINVKKERLRREQIYGREKQAKNTWTTPTPNDDVVVSVLLIVLRGIRKRTQEIVGEVSIKLTIFHKWI